MDALTSFFSQIPFFQSALFGIIAMIIVGSSWCLIGLVMGDAPKRGIEPSMVQMFGGLVSFSISFTLMLTTSAYPTSSLSVTMWTCAAYAYGGVSNFFMLQIMSHAMQRGPNGVIWCIIQSAMLFPFLSGVIFFGIHLNIFRCLGIVLLLTALVLFGLSKDNSTKQSLPGSWKIPAFAGLAIAAVQQCLATMPSYYPEAREVASITRALASSSGIAISAVLYTARKMTPVLRQQLKDNFRSRILWKYVLILQGFSLLFAYTLFYPGLDAMAANGLGGMCYPMLVGSCIVSFTLSSIFFLKEKIHLIQLIALVCCISGLVCICL